MVAATGVGSGLDIEGLVTQLVNAERAPAENRLLQRETRLTSELSAFGTLQGALSGVQSSLSSLSSLSTFNQRSAATSNSAVLTATASADAATNNYSIEVDQLARSQSLASGSFSELTDVVGEGELSFRFGTTSYTGADPGPESYDGFALNGDRASSSITIDSSNNTLQGVRDAINEAEIGVSAAIVNDGSGFRLLLSSQQTGADNSIEVQVDDTGDGGDTDTSGLSRLAFNAAAAAANGGVANLTQTVAAQDASFSINGLSLASDSNTVSEALGGVNLTLTGTTDGTPETLTVSDNSGAVRGAIEGFVNAFNNFASTAGNLT
ncbi:MAG: flagellar hook-associated protein 2, partial [Halieaceae bacterium]